ncbi:DNA polymerase III subunit chi [Aliidiomarina sedimenti]|uniref:DNA polymerase III subunit chi n=1 Tax=Aliidiomarina sedimenti TaxID=1933879 RepID=A0ABY0BZ66_9GAMM|nr:DNA polymerase III subunit chi [Aliidiomarina sedimenti]RUO30054.1 DNA polymerase III subunit chi [Aliidiomarina sedimenti]
MAHARFYLLDSIGDDNLLPFVCQQVSDAFRQGRRVLVMASDKNQAEAIDELLWQLPAQAFVPHSLTGEGPPSGCPVEVSWPAASQGKPWPLLINLSQQVPSVAQRAQQVIDFVPQDDTARALARERYKQYRQFGIALHTEQATLTAND